MDSARYFQTANFRFLLFCAELFLSAAEIRLSDEIRGRAVPIQSVPQARNYRGLFSRNRCRKKGQFPASSHDRVIFCGEKHENLLSTRIEHETVNDYGCFLSLRILLRDELHDESLKLQNAVPTPVASRTVPGANCT